jgi:hypothetical protein
MTSRPRPTSIARIVVASFALVAALGACSAIGVSPTPRSSGLEPLPSPSFTPFVSGAPSVGPHAGVAGRVLAGPTCPVERNPPDPACAARGVVGAVIVITDAQGTEVARVTSGADGTYAAAVPAGTYTLTPQPVPGLLGVAGPATATVPAAGDGPTVDFSYDTGIR